MKIETDRLIIRSPQKSDFDSSKAIWTDPKVKQYSGGPVSEEDFKNGFYADLENAKTDFGFRSVIEKSSGSHIGDCGLIQKEVDNKQEIEIVYFFNSSFWGSGFATEAAQAMVNYGFNQIGIRRVIALIHPDNEASKKVAIKLGLSFEKSVITNSGNQRLLYSMD
ncbi:MAG: GNAT family N-acetyltransferase [Bdellovibrionales bacterium]|nr:GNAT family N-acetyltransferase [Bdellovibrionales bacterium]